MRWRKISRAAFGRACLILMLELIASILGRGRRITNDDELAALAALVCTEQFRASLGRVACGYDGGQIYDEHEVVNPDIATMDAPNNTK